MSVSVQELLWALSLSGVSFFGPLSNQIINWTYKNNAYKKIEDIPDSIIFGIHDSFESKHKKRITCFMKDRMHITAKDHLKKNFDALINPKTELNIQINHSMMQLYRYNKKTLETLQKGETVSNKTLNIDNDYLTDKVDFMKEVYKYKDCWSGDAFYAYNLGNAIQLVRFAGYHEYITREQVIDYVLQVSKLIQTEFNSYFDFGYKATLGFHVDVARLKASSYSDKVRKDNNRLSHVLYGTWSNIPWKGGV